MNEESLCTIIDRTLEGADTLYQESLVRLCLQFGLTGVITDHSPVLKNMLAARITLTMERACMDWEKSRF